ncbi:Uncharacterised protein [Mycobacteroides abscessus subsp. abscessus]|nr:Uncharacterised protein [Mycobacteroides abscessus subsp. abscessus]
MPKKRLDNINFKQLEVNGEELKADLYGSLASSAYNNQAQFEPFFEKRANKVKLYVDQVYLSFQDNKVVELDAQKDFPQTFEYAGSTISIEKHPRYITTEESIKIHEKNVIPKALEFYGYRASKYLDAVFDVSLN